MSMVNLDSGAEKFLEIVDLLQLEVGADSLKIDTADSRIDQADLSLLDIPQPLAAIYSHYDGQSRDCKIGLFYGLRFMSLSESVEFVEGVKEWFVQASDLAEEVTRYSQPANTVKETTTDPKWWPFACDDVGGYLAVDNSPAANGKQGQIIVFSSEEESNYCLSSSLDEFLSWYSNELKSGLKPSNFSDFVSSLKNRNLPLNK